MNYKHNNMASFIRQLNMYGFHKITSIDNGGLKFDKDEMEFSHPYFQKGHPYLLEHIKRKIANPKAVVETEKAAPKSETVTRVLNEVKNMRGRQESLDTRFSAMKQENEALWREVAILRQKHMKQQQIVNKLIQFLVTIVQPQRSGLGSGIGKRRGQLMINDVPQSKVNKHKMHCQRESIIRILPFFSFEKRTKGPSSASSLKSFWTMLTQILMKTLRKSGISFDLIQSNNFLPFSNITNVQSPGSQSSKGSSSLDQDYVQDTAIPEALASFITNNYENNYYVPDMNTTSPNSGSGDGFSLDDIDEIDTNNMEIYKNGRRTLRSGTNSLRTSVKQEPVEPESLNQHEPVQRQTASGKGGKSLLIPSKNIVNNAQNVVDEQVLYDVLGDQAASLIPGSSMDLGSDQIAVQNTMFDETSQVRLGLNGEDGNNLSISIIAASSRSARK